MSTTYNDRAAAEVRAELGRQRLSQADLAEALGVSQVYVSRRLRGKIAFSIDDLENVARILGVPMEQFLRQDQPAESDAPQRRPKRDTRRPMSAAVEHWPTDGRRRRRRREPVSE